MDEPPSPPSLSALTRQRKQSLDPRPSPSLPTLRLMLYPTPGLGVDARLPLTKQFKCFLSLESFFQGSSTTRFGLESNRFPFFRLDLAPSVRFSIRPSPIRLSDLKFGVFGASFTVYDTGESPKCNFSSLHNMWQSLRPFLNPIVELNHRNTLFGAFTHPQQRKALNNIVNKVMSKQEAFPSQLRQTRDALLKSLHQRGMPPLDHRVRKDTPNPIEGRLREQFEHLKDSSSRSKPNYPHWPGVSRDDTQSSGVESPSSNTDPNSQSADNTYNDGPSVVGHVKRSRDGRLRLLRSDGSIADEQYNSVIQKIVNDEKGFARRVRQIRERFKRNNN